MSAAAEPIRLVTRVLREARLSVEQLAQPPGNVPSQLRTQTRWNVVSIPLPPPSPARIGMGESLQERVSHRTYGPEAVDLATVGTCLSAAYEGDYVNWRSECEAGVNLEFLVIANRVAGVPTGLYRYLSVEHSLIPITAAFSLNQTEELTLQLEFSQAPVILAVTGNLAAALARHSTHGYRQLLVRAGAAAQHAYLAALGQELWGSLFAGILRNPLRRLAGIDNYREAPLFGLSFGLPFTAGSAKKGTESEG